MSERYEETKKISGEIWALYKLRLESLSGKDAWWDDTAAMFNAVEKKYADSTHHRYVHHYCMACLEDLEESWSISQKEKS